PLHVRGPVLKHLLARTGAESQIAAQIEKAGLIHDVLAFLISLDRLCGRSKAFEQYVARVRYARLRIKFGSASGGAESSRPGADYCNSIFIHHTAAPAPQSSPETARARTLLALPKHAAPAIAWRHDDGCA